MEFIFGETKVSGVCTINRMETIDGVMQNVLELWTDAPLPDAAIEHIKSGKEFTDDSGRRFEGYNDSVRFTTWLIRFDPNAVALKQLTDEKAALEAEKMILVQQNAVLLSEKAALAKQVEAITFSIPEMQKTAPAI